MINKIIIMGRLTADPRETVLSSGTKKVDFRIATDRDYKVKGEKHTDFITVDAWGSTGEFVTKYFKKGQMIIVEGSMQIDQWKDDTGNNRERSYINAAQIHFGESKRDEGQQSASGGIYTPEVTYTQAANDDDLPF